MGRFLAAGALLPVRTKDGWELKDERGICRVCINTKQENREILSTLQPEPPRTFDVTILADGKTPVPFMAYDDFFLLNPSLSVWGLFNGMI